jgi:DNA-binding transcriptional LysR family regulator
LSIARRPDAKAPSDWLARSRLTARQLALVVALADEGSVLHAADAVHLTQPAASRLLQTIEEGLGVTLFERHPRGIVPTTFGEALVRHARAALAEFRRAHEELAALASGVAGEVTIGTAITSATDLVPLAVTRLAARHPRVRVAIELGFSEELVAHVVERRVDIAIARLHPSHPVAEVEYEALGEEPHALFARAGHPLARARNLELRDVAAQTWVVPPPGNVMRDALTVLFLQQHVEQPPPVVETSALPVITSLLRASDMIAPLPSEVVRAYVETSMLTQLPVRLDLRLGAAGIVTRRGVELSPAAHALLDELRAAAPKLYPRRRRRA